MTNIETPNSPAPESTSKPKQSRKPKVAKPAAGSTATLAEVASQHIEAPESTSPAPAGIGADAGKVEAPAPSPMLNMESAKALAVVAKEDMEKRNDTMNSFLETLTPALRADVRKEDKAFDKELRGAADKITSAMSHLFKIHGLLDEEQYRQYGVAKVAQGYITAGTLYTLTEKIKVFESLSIADEARHSIMALSGGDSIIIRRELTEDERKEFKTVHPGVKVPRGKYVASPYFIRAIEVIEAPEKWTPQTSDSFAGEVVRLASKLRGKARSGKEKNGDSKDIRATNRLANALDTLEKLISGENVDGEIKGRLTWEDSTMGYAALVETVEAITKSVLVRLPLKECNELYESVDQLFTERVQSLEEKASKQASAA